MIRRQDGSCMNEGESEKAEANQGTAKDRRFAKTYLWPIVLWVALLLLATLMFICWRKLWEPREKCQECTIFLSIAFNNYEHDNDDWNPVSGEGEYQALSKLVKYCDPKFFATYGTSGDQRMYFEDHGLLSDELCPWRYIQGLKGRDPADLVMMYRKSKTNWRSHTSSGFGWQPRWVVSGPCPCGHWGGSEEGWLQTAELARRLRKTLEFLKENKRPYWEETVKEHEPFLRELEANAL